jgi:hypothetical protein
MDDDDQTDALAPRGRAKIFTAWEEDRGAVTLRVERPDVHERFARSSSAALSART